MRGDHFQQGLRLVSFCPLCHTRYRPFEAAVLDACDDAHLLYMQCRACQGALLAVVSLDEEGARAAGLVTDLTKEEVMQYRNAEEIGADDVIATHQLFISQN